MIEGKGSAGRVLDRHITRQAHVSYVLMISKSHHFNSNASRFDEFLIFFHIIHAWSTNYSPIRIWYIFTAFFYPKNKIKFNLFVYTFIFYWGSFLRVMINFEITHCLSLIARLKQNLLKVHNPKWNFFWMAINGIRTNFRSDKKFF